MASAGAASEVAIQEETGQTRRIDTSNVTSVAMCGVTQRGPIGEQKTCTSFVEWTKVYGTYTADNLDVVGAAKGFFDGGGQLLHFVRIVHVTDSSDPTTKTSAAGTLTLQTAAGSATPGVALSGTQPYNLEPNQTLVISIDGGGDQTFTFPATAASRQAGANGPFALTNGMTLQLAINGGSTLTKTFSTSEFVSIGAATVAEVIASINAFLASQGAGAVAASVASTYKITSNRRGTGSSVNIVGGSANAIFTFTTGATTGTGDASDIDAVTAAEVVTKLSTLTGSVAAVVSGKARITSNTTGTSSSVQVKSSSTAIAIGFDNAVHSGSDGTATDTLDVDGKTDGSYTDDVTIQVATASTGEADRFNFYVLVGGVVRERFFNVSMDDSDPAYIETVVNDTNTGSDYVTVTDLDAFGSADALTQRPATGTSGPLTGGDDGLTSLDDEDYIGGTSANGSVGLRCLDTEDVDVIAVPGRATSAVQNALITYCEITRAGLLFAILDPPTGLSAAQMVDYVVDTAAIHELSDKAAIYWPRVLVVNPNKALYGTSPTVVVPPSGHLAGLYTRTDARKVGGAFEQPAGTEFGLLPGVIGLENNDVKKKAQRDIVFPKLINPISQEKGTPIFVDGARTLKASSPWPSVGQRRGVIQVEKALIPGLAFMRHRNIKPRLYKEGERAVLLFLTDLTRNDCFKSTKPSEAFFIDFGPGLNPPSVQFEHKVVARVGLATSEPAEFILLLVSPDTRALDEELAALAT